MGAGIAGIPGMAVTGALLEAGAIMAAALRGRAHARAPVAMGTASGGERGPQREPGPHLPYRRCPGGNRDSQGHPPGALGKRGSGRPREVREARAEVSGMGERAALRQDLAGPGRSQGEARW